MKLRRILFTGCTLLVLFLNAQNFNVDSLKELANGLSGIDKAKIYIDLSNATVYNETKLALDYAQKAFDLSEKSGNDSLKFAALKAMGYANGYLGNFDASMQNMKDGLAYYESINDSSKIAEALSDIAYLLLATSSPENNIMEYNLKALAIREKIGDEKGVAYSLNNIGALYWKWKKFDRAVDYFLKALPYMERLNLAEEIATTTGNIGSYYIEKGDYDKAGHFLQRALEGYQKLNHKYGEAMILATLGRMYYQQKNFDKAIEYNEMSKEIRTKLGDKEGLIANYYNIGLYWMEKGNFAKAGASLNESREIAEEIGISDRLIEIYQTLSDLSLKQGIYQKAYVYLQKSKVLNDSIFSVKKHQQLEEIHAKFDVEKKESENILLKEENKNQQIILQKNRFILYLSLSVAFLVIMFLVVFFLRRRTVDQMKNLVSEQRLLRSQMNPHFIFNSISAIQNYIFGHSPKEAVNYLSAFAGLMRQILENSSKEYIEFEDELKWLENYFSLQKLRYSNRFDYEIEIDEALKAQPLLIPPMIAQPFIENAIEHGIKEMETGGRIWLRYRKVGSLIQIEIEDNGIGILKSKKQKLEEHKSFAIEATKNRLKVLHKKEKTKLSFEVTDKSEQHNESKGTIVKFTLPFNTKF